MLTYTFVVSYRQSQSTLIHVQMLCCVCVRVWGEKNACCVFWKMESLTNALIELRPPI